MNPAHRGAELSAGVTLVAIPVWKSFLNPTARDPVDRFENLSNNGSSQFILVLMHCFYYSVDVHRSVCYFNIQFEGQLELHGRCSPSYSLGGKV